MEDFKIILYNFIFKASLIYLSANFYMPSILIFFNIINEKFYSPCHY